ncbi:carboxypeptidase regulatory-like domain-containing protein, partial [Candidatus Uhrbacteria bacterium]|nr:carboxypeptidase regulatory-like domain-containing protein [Candidatus Uhrbacteria bacterium]
MSRKNRFFLVINFIAIAAIALSPLSALAAKPTIASYQVTTKAATVTFSEDVVNTNTTSSALFVKSVKKIATSNSTSSNWTLESPTGVVMPVGEQTGQWVDYIASSSKAILYGLNLTQGNSYRLSLSGIADTASNTVMDSFATGGIVASETTPVINNLSAVYGQVSNSITIMGADFGTSTGVVEFTGSGLGQGSSGFKNATTSAWSTTEITLTVPSSLSVGYKDVRVKRASDTIWSNARKFSAYNSSSAIIEGMISSTSASDVENMRVVAYREGVYNDTKREGFTQKDGKYAIYTPNTGTYTIRFETPAGATKAAPDKIQNKTIFSLGTVLSLGVSTMLTINVQGSVKNNSDVAIYDAEVVIHNRDWSVYKTARTDSSGNYSFAVVAGDYWLYVNPPAYNPSAYQSVPEAQITAPASGSVTKNFTMTGAQVTGTIKTPTGTASTGNPYPDTAVSNASVYLHTPTWSSSYWGQTDSNGNFNFGTVTNATNYILDIYAPYSGNYRVYPQTTYTDVAISGTTALGVKRFATPNVYGKVLFASSAVENAWISFYKEGIWRGANTDSSGRFGFSVPSGKYKLSIYPPYGGVAAGRYETEIEVSSDEATNGKNLGDITLPTPNVKGKILPSSGSTGVAYVSLSICAPSGPYNCEWGSSDTNGNFTFQKVIADGTWTLNVTYVPTWNTNNTDVGFSPKTIVISGGTITTVDGVANTSNSVMNALRLSDPSVNGLKGTVKGPVGSADENNALSNISVNVRQANVANPQWLWSSTNNSGQFSVGPLSEGTYEVEAQPSWNSSYTKGKLTHTITSSSSTRSNIVVRFTQPKISGTIKTPTAAEVSSSSTNPTPDQAFQWMWVSIYKEGPSVPGVYNTWYGASTDANGAFTAGGMPAGTYTFEVYPNWGTVYSKKKVTGIILGDLNSDGSADECTQTSDTDGNGQTNDGNSSDGSCNLNNLIGTGSIKAIRLNTAQLKGKLVDPNGNAIANSWINVRSSSWSSYAGANTDTSGNFMIGGLSNGTYQIDINTWGSTYLPPSGLSVVITGGTGVIKQNGVNLTDNKIILQEPSKTLTGTVTKSDSTAVANARVELHREFGGNFVETSTNSSGQYTVKVAGGGWWVSVRPSWYFYNVDWVYDDPPRRVKFAEDTTSESKTENFTVAVSNATVTGTVKTPDGTAVSGIWVEVRKGKGGGNGVSTDTNGKFTIKVPEGTYKVTAFPWSNQYGSPAAVQVKAVANQTVDAGTLSLEEKNSYINGTIQDTAGNGVGSVVVSAFQSEGNGSAYGFSSSTTGVYSLRVSKGKWNVSVMPMSTQYIYQGKPKTVTVDSNETKENNDFTLKIANSTIKGKVRLDSASGNIVEDLWGGVWLKDTASTEMLDFGGPLNDIMKKIGMIGEASSSDAGYAGSSDSFGGGKPVGAGFEKGMGTGIYNGAFELKVPAGTYQIGIGMPPGSKYTLATTTQVTMSNDETQDINLIVKQNNVTLSGKFYIDADNDGAYDAGEEATDVRGMV